MSTINSNSGFPGVRPSGAAEGIERTLRRGTAPAPSAPPAAAAPADLAPSALEADLRAFQVIQQNLSSGNGLVSAALGGAQTVARLLGELRNTASEAAQPDNAPGRQSELAQEFTAKLGALRNAIDGAAYNGRNLLAPGAENVSVTAALSGGQLTIEGAPGVGGVPQALTGISVGDPVAATAALGVIGAQEEIVGAALESLGASQKSLEFQSSFVKTIADSTNAGVTSMVDADLAAEAAKIRALQLKQQLGDSPLGIANARPQSLLSLFK